MSSFLGSFDRAAFQRRIDDSIGTADGRPLIKLVWCPTEFRWMPHKLGTDPPGYVFPQFCTRRGTDGELYPPPRWGLLQRLEWPAFGPTWEAKRYKKHKGEIWDQTGPCPDEKYIELRLYADHDGNCCPCLGSQCTCLQINCEGQYAEPSTELLDWIRRIAWESKHDSDVDPMADERFFEAPKAQQELKSEHDSKEQRKQVEVEAFDREAVDLFIRAPHSMSVKKAEIQRKLPTGFKKAKSGLYLPSN